MFLNACLGLYVGYVERVVMEVMRFGWDVCVSGMCE